MNEEAILEKQWERPTILPCNVCGVTPIYAGAHGNTFGPPENWHVHHRCKVICECLLSEEDKGRRCYPDIVVWNRINSL